MGGEGSIMHMIVSYRNNTALIRKKRLMKGGRSYFLAKQAYRTAAGGEAAFRTATPKERAIIKAKIRKESRRDSIAMILIFVLGLSLAIFLSIKLWPDEAVLFVSAVPISESEMADYQFFNMEGNHSVALEKYYNAVFYYEQAVVVIDKKYERHPVVGLKTFYLEELENTTADSILNKLNDLISRFPKRVELYRLRAEIFTRQDMPLLAKEDYIQIEKLLDSN